jgi:hypothetical protein
MSARANFEVRTFAMTGDASRRMLKKAVQQGRRRVETGGVPSVGYVEDFDETRTKLADFFSIRLVRHLVVIKPDMVPKFMDHRVSNLVDDFGLRPAETQDRTSIDSDSGGELTGRLEKRCFIDGEALIQTQQIIF